MIRILVVADHRLVRQGIRALLRTAPEVKLVGEGRNGREELTSAIQKIRAGQVG